MFLLAELENVRAAQGFCDYLNSIGIVCKVQPLSASKMALYVNEGDLAEARHELAAFESNPNDAKYYEASWQVGTTESGLSYSGQSLDLIPRFLKLSPLIQLISLSSLVVYLGFIFGAFNSLFGYLQFNATTPYTWLTPAIMHFSAIHIIFNLMWWMYLGDKVTKELGNGYLVVIFLITALVSNWAQFILVAANFGGLSGVVYGLLGFCWLYGIFKPESNLAISTSVVGFMLVWLVLGFADVLFMSMANWAHLGGLVSGAMLGTLVAINHKKSKVN